MSRRLLKEVPRQRRNTDQEQTQKQELDPIQQALEQTRKEVALRQQQAHQEYMRKQHEEQMMSEMMHEMGAGLPRNPAEAARMHSHNQMLEQQRQMAQQFQDPRSNSQPRLLREIPDRPQPSLRPQQNSGPQLLKEVPRENDTRKLLNGIDPKWRPERLNKHHSEYVERWQQIMAKLEGRRVRAAARDWGIVKVDLGHVHNPYDVAVNMRINESNNLRVVESGVPSTSGPLKEQYVRQINFGGYTIEQF